MVMGFRWSCIESPRSNPTLHKTGIAELGNAMGDAISARLQHRKDARPDKGSGALTPMSDSPVSLR